MPSLLRKLYTECGPEFGEFKGRLAVIRRALYGTKMAAASWRATISKVIKDMGFEMCLADNDVWIRKGFNRDGANCWECVLVYSDDLLVVARNPSKILAHVDQHFKLKGGSVQSTTSYLGADVRKYSLPDGSEAWYLSSNSYMKEPARNAETWLHKREKDNSGWQSFKTKTSCMFPSGWKPELDVTPLLNPCRGCKLLPAADWSASLDV
jgi:hypothetical protein